MNYHRQACIFERNNLPGVVSNRYLYHKEQAIQILRKKPKSRITIQIQTLKNQDQVQKNQIRSRPLKNQNQIL